MAEIILCPLLQVIFEKAASGLLKDIALKCGFVEEIDKLQHTLNFIRAVVEDAEARQVKEKALKIWLAKLKEVAYDVDSLLDEFCLDAIIATRKTQFMTKVLSDFLPSLKPFAVYLELFPKLKEIRNRLDVLAAERLDFRLKEGVLERGCDVEGRRQTGSFVLDSEVVGREEDREAMIELLASNGESGFNGKISVVPIVGLGGIGKTTLAQLSYNDERLTESFQLKMWVCVNEDFNVRKIIKLIIESVTMNKCDFLGMDVLQSQLRQLLRGRRYLLVLDDVWNEDHEEWDKLRISLSDGAEGSKVIVTTRSLKVALIVGTISPYYLKGLCHNDCWELFKQRVIRTHLDE